MALLTRQSKDEAIIQPNADGPTLKLVEWNFRDGTLTGLVEHVGKTKLTEALIQFLSYDGQGNRIGTPSDSISYLSRGDTWRFDAAVARSGEIARVEFCQFVCFAKQEEQP